MGDTLKWAAVDSKPVGLGNYLGNTEIGRQSFCWCAVDL